MIYYFVYNLLEKAILKRVFLLFLLLLAFLAGCCTHTISSKFPPELTYQDRFTEKLVQHLEKSTVVLLQKDIANGTYSSLCAGVWITQSKFLSARHCAENEITGPLDELLGLPVDLRKLPGIVMPYKTHAEFEEKFKIGSSKKPHFAVVTAYDPKSDLVLLDSIDAVDHDIASIYYGKIFDGQNLLIVGHTTGMEYTVFQGMVSKNKRVTKPFGEFWETIQISAPIASGNSGGGAFDLDGNLLGICSYTRGNGINQGFFIHRDAILDFLKGEQVL